MKRQKKELDRALNTFIDKGSVENNIGYYYTKKGQIKKAIVAYYKAIDADPVNTLYYNNLGYSLLSDGQKAEGIEVLKKSLSLDSNQESVKETLKRETI